MHEAAFRQVGLGLAQTILCFSTPTPHLATSEGFKDSAKRGGDRVGLLHVIYMFFGLQKGNMAKGRYSNSKAGSTARLKISLTN